MNLFKKVIFLSALIFAVGSAASAAVIEFTIGDTNFATETEGEVSKNILEAAPFISDGRTMVPVRAISDAFGANTDWEDKKREVKILSGDKEILLTIDNPLVVVNGEEKKLDAAPVIVNGRTFVPLRFVSEELSYNVNYVNATKQVIIDNTDIVVKCGEEKISLAEFEALYRILYDANHYDVETGDINEDDYSFYLTQAVLQTVSNYAKVYNTFPSVGLSADDCNAIKAAIESEKGQIKTSMEGMTALIYEKQYFSNGNSIINNLLEEENFEKKYLDEFISAKHILVKDESLANDIHKELIGGADFDELVKEYNEDPGMEKNPDGYVFTKGDMVKEFEDASYSLNVGDLSKPVKSDYGYHIIKRMPLPEISDSIKKEMAVQRANEIINAAGAPEILIDEYELAELMK